MFWKSKIQSLNSDEYDKLSKKITTLTSDIQDLAVKIAYLDTLSKSLRQKLNQHMRLEIDEEEEEKEKSINKGEYL